jgi:hypothetical protein
MNQYKEYLDELKEFREELGVPLKEEMYPDKPKHESPSDLFGFLFSRRPLESSTAR